MINHFQSVLEIFFYNVYIYYGDFIENDILRQYFKHIYISFVHIF